MLIIFMHGFAPKKILNSLYPTAESVEHILFLQLCIPVSSGSNISIVRSHCTCNVLS